MGFRTACRPPTSRGRSSRPARLPSRRPRDGLRGRPLKPSGPPPDRFRLASAPVPVPARFLFLAGRGNQREKSTIKRPFHPCLPRTGDPKCTVTPTPIHEQGYEGNALPRARAFVPGQAFARGQRLYCHVQSTPFRHVCGDANLRLNGSAGGLSPMPIRAQKMSMETAANQQSGASVSDNSAASAIGTVYSAGPSGAAVRCEPTPAPPAATEEAGGRGHAGDMHTWRGD